MNARHRVLKFLFVAVLLIPATDSRSDEPAKAEKRAGDPMLGKKLGQVRDDNGLKIKLVWCPAGKLVMENRTVKQERVKIPVGVEKPDNDDVAVEDLTGDTVIGDLVEIVPVVAIVSRGFWLGKYEVRRDEWQAMMHSEPWANRKVNVTGGDFPATYVSWNDAVEFCKLLSDQERNAGQLPDGWEYTLPTEAQWEVACRAETETRFSFGDDASRLGGHAWIRANTIDRNEPYSHRVGRRKPNPWGLCDMHGNVSEWCRDWSGPFPGGKDPEIKDPVRGLGSMKVQRGGGWNGREVSCRSNARDCAPPDLRKIHFGFRVALSTVR